MRSKNDDLIEAAKNLELKNTELTQPTERLQEFVTDMFDELRDFDIAESPRVKPSRDRLLNSFNDIMLQVVEELPKTGNAEPVYAGIKMGLVESLIDQQKTDEAEPILDELQEVFKRRVTMKQGSDSARNNLVLLMMKIGNLKRDLRRDLRASLNAHQQALEIAQSIVDHPKAADDGKGLMPVYLTRTPLADSHTNLGSTCYRLGDPQKALEHLESALSLRRQVIVDFDASTQIPGLVAEDRPRQREYLVDDLQFKKLGMAAALFRAGRAREAEPLLKETYEASLTQLAEDPHNPRLVHDVVGQAEMWAEFLGYTNRGPEALVVLEEAEKYLNDLLADDPYGVAFQRTVSVALYRLSQWRKELGQGDFETPLRQCLEIRRKLAAKELNNDRRQLDLMLALARDGESAEAIAIANKYLAGTNPDNEMLMEIARAFSQCANFAATEAEREPLETTAVTTINRAIKAGFRDTVFLSGELDLKPIRGRWSL